MSGKVRTLYENELKGVRACSAEEMGKLLPLAQKGDEKAFQRLVEGNLHHVAEAAAFFDPESLYYMDLIQEGSMALMLFLKAEPAFKEDTEFRMKQAVKDGMVAFVDAEKESMMSGAELSRRLNLIDRVTMELTEKLDRAPSAEEVAELMKMDVGDVRYLMGIALSAINKE